MTRKTVMHRETEVFVVEERLAPRKEAIKRRVKLERCIAAGINLGEARQEAEAIEDNGGEY